MRGNCVAQIVSRQSLPWGIETPLRALWVVFGQTQKKIPHKIGTSALPPPLGSFRKSSESRRPSETRRPYILLPLIVLPINLSPNLACPHKKFLTKNMCGWHPTQWARRDILMSRVKNGREPIFASQLSRNYPCRGCYFQRGIKALSPRTLPF